MLLTSFYIWSALTALLAVWQCSIGEGDPSHPLRVNEFALAIDIGFGYISISLR